MSRISRLIEWRNALRDSDISANAKLVGFILSTHMDAMGGSCFPAVKTIAHEASRCDRAVRNALRELEDAQLLLTEQGGGRRSSRYHALVPSYAECVAASSATHEMQVCPATDSTTPAPLAAEGVPEDVHKSSVRLSPSRSLQEISPISPSLLKDLGPPTKTQLKCHEDDDIDF